MAYDTRNVKLGVCRVIFDGVDLGLTKGGVEVEVATETQKVEVDQFGKTPINEIIMGRTVSAKVPLAETILENMVKIMPGAVLNQVGGAKATGTITVSTQPVANDNVVVNGVVFTFKATSVAANEVTLGANAAGTAANLQAALAAYTDPKVSVAEYTVVGAIVTATYRNHGVVGNAFTLAKTVGTGLTFSGATLSGGVDYSKANVTVPVAISTDLLQIAKKLVLHPIQLADSNKSEDFVIPKAATAGALTFAYKLDQERVFNVSFMGYPDPLTNKLFIVGDETAG
jgi:hypothetical protein